MSTEHALRRLFFALWPDSEMQAALAEVTRRWVAGIGGKPIPPENFHFTLAFLGTMDDRRLPELEPIAESVAAAFVRRGLPQRDLQPVNDPNATIPNAIAIDIGGGDEEDEDEDESDAEMDDGAGVLYSGSLITVTLDHIEHWARPEILCATASEKPAEAIVLADALKSELVAHGFAPDLKPFRPHATLARKVRRVTREMPMEPVHWTFREFHLIESQPHPNGSVYSSREIYPL